MNNINKRKKNSERPHKQERPVETRHIACFPSLYNLRYYSYAQNNITEPPKNFKKIKIHFIFFNGKIKTIKTNLLFLAKKMGKEYKYGNPYKAKSLLVASNSEWMNNSKDRKYRKVFDRQEISYLFFTFQFYNKLFDEEDWTAEIKLVIEDQKYKTIATLKDEMTVSKNENLFEYYNSWGNKTPGAYWEKGSYTITAYIDNDQVIQKKFYIYDAGIVSQTINPYFDLISLKVYENNAEQDDPIKYLKQFDKKTTRYVWAEIKAKNKYKKESWILEYFLNFYDDAGQLKASIKSLNIIDAGQDIITISHSWGSETPGTWRDDKYSLKFVFMDVLQGATFFSFGDEAIEGENKLLTDDFHTVLQKQIKESTAEEEMTLEDAFDKLNSLIGLEKVKNQVKEHIDYLKFVKLRKEKGLGEDEEISLHSAFLGNPGTGKTTVVRLLGKIYNKMGLLSKGHVVEADRSTLVAEYIGQTAPKVKEAIKNARGGILFIDEAYALFRSKNDEKDYGREVIEILIKEMSDGPGDIAIMFAGYPKEMNLFLESNPGLKSRISYYFNFPDYTPDELLEIAKFAADKKGLVIAEEAIPIFEKIITNAYRNRDRAFGNARFVFSLVDTAKMNMGIRIVKQSEKIDNITEEELKTIKKEDIEPLLTSNSATKKINIQIDEYLLSVALTELDSLLGLEQIKKDVHELIKLVKYYHEIGRDTTGTVSLHTVFTGNPGTGKTTVARILGKIYKALGLLERGHIIEVGRQDLIAGYIGQTAIKTQKVLDKAMGGVLFIDEAYGLTSEKNSYGGEAIEVILKNMEDHRGEFALIVAGYPNEMNVFLKSNPGLMSRFDHFFHFKDYDKNVLMSIAKKMLADKNQYFNNEAAEFFENYLIEILKYRDKYFGNAREIRRLIDDIVKRQNLRVADIPADSRTTEDILTITIDDIKHLHIQPKKAERNIGFS